MKFCRCTLAQVSMATNEHKGFFNKKKKTKNKQTKITKPIKTPGFHQPRWAS
jgi:hypothetical protein